MSITIYVYWYGDVKDLVKLGCLFAQYNQCEEAENDEQNDEHQPVPPCFIRVGVNAIQ